MEINNNKAKNKFSSRIGFLAAASGAAIGLGNIWRFPYEVGINGGACFLILYLIFTFLIGYPIVVTKIAFGRSIGKSIYSCYKNEGAWKILSISPAILCLVLFSFYCVVTGWILGYSFELITGSLLRKKDLGLFFTNFTKDVPKNLIYTFIIMALIALIIKSGIQKGIELSSKVLMPLFILIIVCLVAYSLTLEGTLKGLKFYLLPNLKLITKKSILSALSQSFLSLTIGASVMITYGAYTKQKLNLVNDGFIIVLSDFLIAFFAGLLIFPLIFYKGINPTAGPPLIFISLPHVFKSLGPYVGFTFGFMFFLLLVFAALTSAISMLEITTSYVMERWNISRKKSVTIIFVIAYILSIPNILSNGGNSIFTKLFTVNGHSYSFMDILDFLIINYGMPILGLLFCLFISKKWNKYNINKHISTDNKNKIIISYIHFCVKIVSPILIILSIILNLF